MLLPLAAQLIGDGVDRFIVAAEGVVHPHQLFGMQGRQQGSDRGLEIRFRFRGPGRHHNSLGIADQGSEFLGVVARRSTSCTWASALPMPWAMAWLIRSEKPYWLR